MGIDQLLLVVSITMAAVEAIWHRSILAGAFAFYVLSVLV